MRIGALECTVLLSAAASVCATSPVPDTNVAALSALTTSSREVLEQESHKCTGYCGGPTCGDVCSCSRMNFCFKGPSVGPDLYRIWNRAAGEVTAYRNNKTVGLSHMPHDGPQVEWKLKSVGGDVYQIVSKDLGSPVVYDSHNPAVGRPLSAPLVASKNQTFPAEWSINRVGEAEFLVRLLDEDLYWTATANRSSVRTEVTPSAGVLHLFPEE
ncbi:hypothetical protein C8R44DRAFT_752179 [Mycena epipterygia]|nr:hypothetical protein C8R44DRAFT_752179 [Mycena epipterygia]